MTNAEPLWFTQLTVKCFHFSHEQNLDRSSIADPWIVRRSQSSLIRATALCGGIAGSTTYVTKYKLGTEIRAVPSTLIVGPHATVKWSRVHRARPRARGGDGGVRGGSHDVAAAARFRGGLMDGD